MAGIEVEREQQVGQPDRRGQQEQRRGPAAAWIAAAATRPAGYAARASPSGASPTP